MYDLTDFGLAEMAKCSAALRKLGNEASGLGEVAEKSVRFLYENLVDRETKSPACALVRFFKSHAYGALSPDLKRFVDQFEETTAGYPEMPCLTLLASAGDREEWNSPETSAGHRAIPLVSEQMIAKLPMISQLFLQLGFDASIFFKPDPTILVDMHNQTFNVFHVPDVLTSPHVPAKDFISSSHVKSAVGFGGMLPNGELFAMILFSKVAIPRETAEMFKTLPLSIKISILPFMGGPLFG